MILVLQGSDERRDGTGIPDPPEGIGSPASQGRVLFIQGCDQWFDGGGTDSCQRVRGSVSDGCVLVLQGIDQRPDGGAADVDKGIGSVLADAEVFVLQCDGQGFNGAGIPNLSECDRRGTPDREIFIPKGGDQCVNGAGILHRSEGGGCVPADGRIFSGQFLNKSVCGIDIFPLGKTGTEREQNQHGQHREFEKAKTRSAFIGSHDASRTFGWAKCHPPTISPDSFRSHGRVPMPCRSFHFNSVNECCTDGEWLSTP